MRIALTSQLHSLRRLQWTSAAALWMTLLLGALSVPVLAASAAGGGVVPAQAESSLGRFLDATGHLQLPPGFSGSINPSGYRIVSGEGEGLRFAPEVMTGGSFGGAWTGLGGIANGCNGRVSVVAIGSAGQVYVGGEFTQCGGIRANRVARFDTTTQTWSSLGSGTANGVDDAVRAYSISGNAIYVGGLFTHAGGVPANRVARFDIVTQTWSSLGNGMANGLNGPVLALAVSGSVLYLGGAFSQAGGLPANYIARFDTTAQTWNSLGAGAFNGVDSSVFALALSGSTVYAGGTFGRAGGAPAIRIARFDADTQFWSSLGTGVSNFFTTAVYALAVSGDVVYVGGSFTHASGVTASRVARFDSITQTWASLGSGAANGVNLGVTALVVSGSSLYLGGSFTQAGEVPASRIAHFDTTTQSWSNLGTGVDASVFALAIDADGSVYVGGDFTSAGGQAAAHIARYRTEVIFGNDFELVTPR